MPNSVLRIPEYLDCIKAKKILVFNSKLLDQLKTNDGSPFPVRLKQARLRKNLSQKQLGILAGMDKFVASARMNQYERGVHTPDFKTVLSLSSVLEVPTAFLFCVEDELAEKILGWASEK